MIRKKELVVTISIQIAIRYMKVIGVRMRKMERGS